MLIVRPLILMFLGSWLFAFLSAQQCVTQQNAVRSLQASIKADQDRIRQLNTGLTADELHRWAKASEEEQCRILVQSLTDVAKR